MLHTASLECGKNVTCWGSGLGSGSGLALRLGLGLEFRVQSLF
jgi:hypothetical protein